MSAFGGGGSDDFEEEEGHVETPFEQRQDPEPSNFPKDPSAPAALPSTSPTGPGHLSGESSAFDDEDDYSSPLHQAAIAKYAEAANVSIVRPKEETLFSQAPPSLTISNGRDALSKVNLNPLQSSASTGAQSNLSSSVPSTASAAASHSLQPSVNSSLPRIHTSPATYDDSKTSLEALWAQQAATDPSLFTHAVYTRQTHFGKGEVHVTDPEKKGDGITSYITYKVKSAIEHTDGHVTETTVSRRYSDFLWLHEHLFLNVNLAGFLIPPIPNKAVVGRFAEDFVEERRRSLEMFIKRVVSHPIVRTPEATHVSLTQRDTALRTSTTCLWCVDPGLLSVRVVLWVGSCVRRSRLVCSCRAQMLTWPLPGGRK